MAINPYSAMDGGTKVLNAFIKSQENLSSTRFIQDTATNWLPKAVFSRSKEDFAEMSFLEFIESGIFYFAAPIMGEHVFRNGIFKAAQNPSAREKVNELIPKSVDAIKNNKAISESLKRRSIAAKAGITLACACIPIAEYNLSFAKNLFTLKTFKKADFNNVVILNKNQKEDPKRQERVEKHSKNQLKKAAIYSGTALIGGLLLAKFGAKSDKLQKFSENLLEPGKNLSKKMGGKGEKFLSEYGKLDFDEEKGKLALSKGQLALTAISGLFGYSKAAEDRGELDKKEVWTRVPLVVFYTIFGSSLFDSGFKKALSKKGKFPDLIQKGKDGKLKEIPKSVDLPEIAKTVSKAKNTNAADELKRLTKEKAFITGVPYAFSLLFMGFSLSLISRLWTQYRYNKMQKENIQDFPEQNKKFKNNLDDVFSAFA
ncbi:MAG: hypothetical protein LUE64_04835 [Candidatus Gastranaerophilales bacterium]|nr:hypothetical protein [Candidatus Gastranaerophilales bacterium]